MAVTHLPKEFYPIPCRVCNELTHMYESKLCTRCCELEIRIHSHPKLAKQILDAMNSKPE